MTTEMDALPESVREAVFGMDVGAYPRTKIWQTIRAELLRLTARVRELEGDKAALNEECKQHLRQAMENGAAAIRAEAELAAIKMRIAERLPRTVNNDGWVFADFDLIGKRVALLPLDDEAKS